MMAEALGNWIVVRDAERMQIFENCTDWDHLTFLSALSSDPRSWEELAIAWSRYHRDESWSDIAWREIQQLPPTASEDSDRMFIDLTQQIYALVPEEEPLFSAGPYKSEANPERPVWINVPPWWTRQSLRGDALVALSPTGSSSDCASTTVATPGPPANFREVLFGGEFLEFVADRMLAQGRILAQGRSITGEPGVIIQPSSGKQPLRKQPSRKRRKKAVSKAVVRKRRGSVSAKEALKVIRQAHSDWLMTPRDSLGSLTPRECLHWHREWKDAELDFRRAQWSRERQPPPAVPVTSHLFQSGPMGIEEVVCYFEYCRELLAMALRWVIQEPNQTRATLVYALMNFQQQLLDGPTAEYAGGTLREMLKRDRQLMPQLAGNEPIDCDCPLCRMQASQSELFGPAFLVCDGFQLEMEDDFAFSLYADREEWEMMRDPWLDDTPNRTTIEPARSKNSRKSRLDVRGDRQRRRRAASRKRQQARRADNDSSDNPTVLAAFGMDRSESIATQRPEPGKIIDPQANVLLSDTLPAESDEIGGPPGSVWKSSFVAPTSDPRLSLFSIGARLAELIELLKSQPAPRDIIDRLNASFDQLSAGTSNWLLGRANEEGSQTQSIERAVVSMVEVLEEVTQRHPTLTAHSADLQSLVDQWQRQLLTH